MVIAEILAGGTYESVGEKYGVGKGTLARWVAGLSVVPKSGTKKRNGTEQNLPVSAISADARREHFTERFHTLIDKSFSMLEAWAHECSDPEFIRSKPEECNELGRTVVERCDRLVALLVRGQRARETEDDPSGE